MVAIFAVIWGAVLLLAVALFFVRGQREAAGWAGVLGVLTAMAGLIGPQVERHITRSVARRKNITFPQSETTWLVHAAARLADAVRDQWQEEARLRSLTDPWPLPVNWITADELTDPAHTVPVPLAGTGRGVSADVRLEGDLDEVAEIFEGIPSRRLVILGPPGSGKSVLALVLLLELLARREPGALVPVLMSLSTWDPVKIALGDWLAFQLSESYQLSSPGEQDSRMVARQLLRNNLILPILDGLDEIPNNTRPDAINEINGWLGRDRAVIVTSRVEEYQATVDASDVITRGAAVVLQPLTHEMVEGFLMSTTPKRRMARWDLVFAEMAGNPRGALASVLHTPLMVALARAIYGSRPGDPQVLLEPRFAEPEQLEEHLLSELLRTTYPDSRRSLGYPARWRADDVRAWLTFLACNLGGRGQPDVAWWQLEGAAPPVVVHAVAAGAGGVVVGFVFGPVAGLIFAAAALTLGTSRRRSLEAMLEDRLDHLRQLTTTPRKEFFAFLIGLGEGASIERRFALSVGRIVALAAGLIQGFLVYQKSGLYQAVAEGVGLGLAVGLADGYLTVSLRSGPSEIRFVSRRGAAAFFRHVAIGFATGVGIGVTTWAISSSWFGVLVGILVGVAFGLIDGLNIWLDVSTDVTRAFSPRSTRRAERIAALARCLTIGITLIITTGIAYTFAYGISAAIVPAVIFGLGYAIADRHMGLATSVWGRYIAAKTWLATFGRVPWQFMMFLDNAHRLGLLRRVGAIYQFRHARLQEHLARPHADALTKPT